jgi:hypothetical protein
MKHQNIHGDKLIFDYLEGSLSGNERSAFEAQLESDPALQEEIAMWKLTFLDESFSATPWNELLMRPVRKSKWALFLNSFTFGFLLFIVSGNSKEETAMHVKEKSTVLTSAIITRPDTTRSITSRRSIEYGECSQEVITVKVEHTEKETEGLLQYMPPEQLLATQRPLQLTLPVARVRKFEPVTRPFPPKKKISNYRKASRKELRAINREKRKQHAMKLEKEFLKGNVPYVVPLDLKNF